MEGLAEALRKIRQGDDDEMKKATLRPELEKTVLYTLSWLNTHENVSLSELQQERKELRSSHAGTGSPQMAIHSAEGNVMMTPKSNQFNKQYGKYTKIIF